MSDVIFSARAVGTAGREYWPDRGGFGLGVLPKDAYRYGGVSALVCCGFGSDERLEHPRASQLSGVFSVVRRTRRYLRRGRPTVVLLVSGLEWPRELVIRNARA